MRSLLTSELQALAWRLAACAAIGVLVGLPAAGVALGVLWYLGRHLHQIWQLYTWLGAERTDYPPEGDGLWGAVYHRLYLRQREDARRKRQVARLFGRFRQSARSIPDGMIVLDERGAIEWTNRIAVEMFGIDVRRDRRMRIVNLVRNPRFVEFLAAGPSSEPLVLPSPVRPGMLVELRMVDFGEGYHLLIARDATERHRVDKMRRDFVANVSHELRTPLTVLSGHLENMERDGEAVPEPWRRPVEAMREQVGRMRNLVEDLLLLARVEASSRPADQQPVDVPALLAAAHAEALQVSGRPPERITLECEAGLRLRGVAEELQTVITNLVMNAVQYTGPEQAIEITWRLRDDGQACFAVRDHGDGIEAEHLSRLTERFYRVDSGRSRAQGGTGLGLAIVKHVLERHGAWLEIESEPGAGSLFRCVFPAAMVLRGEGALRAVG